MQILNPGIARQLVPSITLAALLSMPAVAMATAPGFDLDLKELKKPSALPTTQKKRTVSQKPTQPQNKSKAPAKTAQQRKKEQPKPVATATTAVPPPLPSSVPPAEVAERLVFLDGATACPLARQLLEAVAEPVSLEQALHGISIPSATAAASHQGLTALLACGLPAAEAYTFRRLLEADGVQLVNLEGDEQPEQVVQAVALKLGLSYRQLQDTPLSYLIDDHQGRPIRLKLHRGVAQ